MSDYEYGDTPDGPPVLGYVMAGAMLTTMTLIGSLIYSIFM